jgi:sugar lactone lactonase YvrE
MTRTSQWLGSLALICAGCAVVLTAVTPAAAFDHGEVEVFAVLPDGATGPEGIAVADNGDVYVGTFGFNAAGGPAAGPGKIHVFSKDGGFLRTVTVAGTTSRLLGLDFHPVLDRLLVIDFGSANVRVVNRVNGVSSVFMTLPAGMAADAGLNAMTFDAAGNTYVSDSFQGIIWRVGPAGGEATAWVTNALLTTPGTPPFGANGIAFNRAQNALFVANTGSDTIVRIPVSGGTPGTPAIFVNSINGADGLLLDAEDNIWVAANQADEIVVLDPTGKVIAKLGDFNGLTHNGVPKGLLFPASIAFGRNGRTLYVTNLALDIRHFGLAQSGDSQWTAQVNRYTVSKLRTKFKPLRGP